MLALVVVEASRQVQVSQEANKLALVSQEANKMALVVERLSWAIQMVSPAQDNHNRYGFLFPYVSNRIHDYHDDDDGADDQHGIRGC